MSMMHLDTGRPVGPVTKQRRDEYHTPIGTMASLSEWDAAQTTSVPHPICFTPGTMILTDTAERAIETLRPGDRVVTRDNGVQHIRWIGRRRVAGHGSLAPVALAAHAVQGAHGPLLVSPHHKVLYTGYVAELLFGEVEVLVAAKDLIDGKDVLRQPCDQVTYIHIMFDHHEVIYANGVGTESCLASDTVLSDLEDATREDLFTTLPGLRSASTSHLKPARPCLATHEAHLLSHAVTGTKRPI